MNVLATTAVIYALSWGPALAVGFLFVLAREMEERGPDVLRPGLVWTAVALAGGEVAIALGFVSTSIPEPEVHGLAVLMGLGVAFALQLLASKIGDQQRSEADLRQLFADNPQPMWVFDAETLQFLEVNEAAVHHYGFTRAEFLSSRVSDLQAAAGDDHLDNVVAMSPGQPFRQGQSRHQLKDGRVVDVEVRSHAFVFERRPAVLAAVDDLT